MSEFFAGANEADCASAASGAADLRVSLRRICLGAEGGLADTAGLTDMPVAHSGH